jgi:hypothetical protein
MLLDMTVETAAMLFEREAPLEAEHLLSSLVGIWEQTDLGGDDPVKVIGGGVVDAAEAEGSPRAFALLTGLAIFGGERVAPHAHAAASRLAELRAEVPAWLDSLGRATLREAWKTLEVFGDGELVTLVLEHRGYAPHAIVVLIDHNLGSAAKDIFVTADAGRFRTRWERDAHDVTVVDIDPQEAADVIGHGLEFEQAYANLPTTENFHRLRPLVRTYLKTLPPPREIVRPTITEDERDRLAADFAASAEARDLDQALIDDLAWRAILYGCDYSDGDPLRWSPVVVELFMVDWLPRKALLEVPAEAVPDAMRAWVRFAGRRRGLPERLIEEAVTAVARWTPEFERAINDPSRFGPSKAIFGAMLDEGIDITDKAAVDEWVREFNARPEEGRRKVLP